MVYRGRYGEVLIHPHLYKPCCQRRRPQAEPQAPKEPGQEAAGGCRAARTKEEEEEEEEEKTEGELCAAAR